MECTQYHQNRETVLNYLNFSFDFNFLNEFKFSDFITFIDYIECLRSNACLSFINNRLFVSRFLFHTIHQIIDFCKFFVSILFE
jgi:hypothetical protein